MSVRIRFTRVGRPHAPFFRLVAIDRLKARDAKPLEVLGTFNPRAGKAAEGTGVNIERLRYWISQGAQATDTVVGTLKKVGVWQQVRPTNAESSK